MAFPSQIRKHASRDSCWFVRDGRVYDATSFLNQHPGGAAAILGQAGMQGMRPGATLRGIACSVGSCWRGNSGCRGAQRICRLPGAGRDASSEFDPIHSSDAREMTLGEA